MKILHITENDRPGAGGAVHQLHDELLTIGAESKMLVMISEKPDKHIIKYTPPKETALNKVSNRISQLLAHYKTVPYIEYWSNNHYLFTLPKTLNKISKHPLIKEADIIHLHWISYMVDYEDFFANLTGKRIIWTLHDKNPFTGGCHTVGHCTNYERGCGSCYQLDSNNPNDLSRKVFLIKQKAYEKHALCFVAPSQQMLLAAKKSLLLRNSEIHCIPHGVSLSIFKKREKSLSRNLLNLPQDKILILFGAFVSYLNKGFNYLQEALAFLKGKKVDFSRVAVVTFGPKQNAGAFEKKTGIPIYQLGLILDRIKLSHAYSSCDVFVNTSPEESFSQTCLEAMSCETPVVAFPVGAMPEIITSNKTGVLANLKDADDLAGKIEYILSHPEERQEIGANARKHVEQAYNIKIEAKRYYDIYKGLL